MWWCHFMFIEYALIKYIQPRIFRSGNKCKIFIHNRIVLITCTWGGNREGICKKHPSLIYVIITHSDCMLCGLPLSLIRKSLSFYNTNLSLVIQTMIISKVFKPFWLFTLVYDG